MKTYSNITTCFFIVEQVLAFASNINLVRVVKNISENSKKLRDDVLRL